MDTEREREGHTWGQRETCHAINVRSGRQGTRMVLLQFCGGCLEHKIVLDGTGLLDTTSASRTARWFLATWGCTAYSIYRKRLSDECMFCPSFLRPGPPEPKADQQLEGPGMPVKSGFHFHLTKRKLSDHRVSTQHLLLATSCQAALAVPKKSSASRAAAALSTSCCPELSCFVCAVEQ